MILFERINGELALETHKTTWYQRIVAECESAFYLRSGRKLKKLDPFARNNPWAGEYTNDADPDTESCYNRDAKDFLIMLTETKQNNFDLCVFDPPFSIRQSERYPEKITNVYTKPRYVQDCFAEIVHLLRAGGYVLKFGFNTNRHHTGLSLCKVWAIAHGGNHNDTLVTLWRKEFTTLEMFEHE